MPNNAWVSPLLALIYGELANGGFGPDYQLLSLINGPTSEQAVDRYTDLARGRSP
ncbi:hypothetical protein ABGB08_06645 [Acrocarpospora sp. B8E8]